jgi:hypothetical protein
MNLKKIVFSVILSLIICNINAQTKSKYFINLSYPTAIGNNFLADNYIGIYQVEIGIKLIKINKLHFNISFENSNFRFFNNEISNRTFALLINLEYFKLQIKKQEISVFGEYGLNASYFWNYQGIKDLYFSGPYYSVGIRKNISLNDKNSIFIQLKFSHIHYNELSGFKHINYNQNIFILSFGVGFRRTKSFNNEKN